MSDALALSCCVLFFVACMAFWLWMEIESAKKLVECRLAAKQNGYVALPPPKPSKK